MKASEVLELVRAGFTSAEIKAMEQPAADLPEQVAEAPAPVAEAPAEQVTVAPETVAPVAPAEEIRTDPKLDEIMAEVKALQQKIIQKNVTNSEMPATKEITPEDILAAVIGGKK